jgi:hypothetical protein
MRPQPIGFRLLAVLLAGGLIAGPMVPPAWAQGDGGPAQTGPEVTPTMQVGALAWMQGRSRSMPPIRITGARRS